MQNYYKIDKVTKSQRHKVTIRYFNSTHRVIRRIIIVYILYNYNIILINITPYRGRVQLKMLNVTL